MRVCLPGRYHINLFIWATPAASGMELRCPQSGVRADAAKRDALRAELEKLPPKALTERATDSGVSAERRGWSDFNPI